MTIGVDVGGTKVAAALVTESGEISHKTRVPMTAMGDAAMGLGAVRAAIDGVFEAAPDARDAVTGIGICSPGPLDPLAGVVVNPPNLPCWRDYPLAAEVEKAFAIPTKLDNDANAAGLAEAVWGAGVGYNNVFFTILGTGIGTGIVFDKKIYHGRTGSAAEGGHLTIDYQGPKCGCGKLGCIEALASGPNIAKRAQAILTTTKKSKIRDLAGSINAVQAEHVGQAYQQGDSTARDVLTETAMFLTIWLGNIIDVLEPDVMVFGGGVAEMMSSFFDGMRMNLAQWSINQRAAEIPMVLAKYGNDAGIVGAAALCH
jgi:glucokinase